MTKNVAVKKRTRQGGAALRDLRGGLAGVRRWNARPAEEREAADLRAADLSGARLRGVDLGMLDLRGSRLDGAVLNEAWLRQCNLAKASLKGADLTKAWCQGARFRAADLEDASLVACNLTSCDLRRAVLRGCDLSGAALDGSDLRGADLTAANLKGVTLRGACFDEATRWPDGFDRPDGLRGADGGEAPMDFDAFMKRLASHADAGRLSRALAMLQADRFKLFVRLEDGALTGIVKSQTTDGLVYSCRLDCEGHFACCTQDLRACLGMRGALCKHLLVLIVGLAKGGEMDRAALDQWVKASAKLRRGPGIDAEKMSETLLRYKGAEAGRIDWRPVETIPEDYYAF